MRAEILWEIYRAQLATGGVKRNRLPRALHIPRPGQTSRAQARPARRHASTPQEILAALRAGFG